MKNKMLFIILLALIYLLVLQKCNIDSNNIKLSKFIKKEMEFEIQKESLNGIIAKQKIEILESSKELQKYLQENAQLREEIKIQSNLALSLEIENKKLKKVKEEIKEEGNKSSTYELQDQCATMSLTYYREELFLNSLNVSTDLTLSVSQKGTVSAVLSNQCIVVNSMNSLEVVKKQKWWENGWVRFGAGVLVGSSLIFLK
jgi:hypothetical protein